jgi:RimJ/RimL family protein N-acetyltransferase
VVNVNRVLRAVRDDDLPALFEHQRDPESVAMAAFPGRDREAFDAHWAWTRLDEAVVLRTIEVDGAVAGTICSFLEGDRRMVGYWIAREQWGRGIASAALAEFLDVVGERPLVARVATHNAGSQRVLEKCGFERARDLPPGPDGFSGIEFVLR